MFVFSTGNLLKASLVISMLATHVCSSAVHVNIIENDQTKVQQIFSTSHYDTQAAGEMARNLPLSYGQCYWLSKSGHGRIISDPADPYNVMQFKEDTDQKRPFKLCYMRDSCFNWNLSPQWVKGGSGFYLWSFTGWPNRADTNRDYMASDLADWFFPSNDGWGNEYIRFKGEYESTEDNGYIIRLSLADTASGRKNPKTGLVLDGKILKRTASDDFVEIKFNPIECPDEPDDQVGN
ncbi:hypothetical protein BDW59DRAFT_161258 [Aspergillus cavernicola]|uniref:Uncharacterized protein n=1 Tax=Aspergillus cavernicola TaxID=176166 RepID=A0ABR4IEG4_9EURO